MNRPASMMMTRRLLLTPMSVHHQNKKFTHGKYRYPNSTRRHRFYLFHYYNDRRVIPGHRDTDQSNTHKLRIVETESDPKTNTARSVE